MYLFSKTPIQCYTGKPQLYVFFLQISYNQSATSRSHRRKADDLKGHSD